MQPLTAVVAPPEADAPQAESRMLRENGEFAWYRVPT